MVYKHVITERDNIRAFFTDEMRKLVRVRGVEEMAGLPVKTLIHFLKYRRDLRDDHVAKLLPILKKVGYKPLGNQYQQTQSFSAMEVR